MMKFWTALNSGMGRRLLLVIGSAMFGLLVVFAGFVGRETGVYQQRVEDERLAQTASAFASSVSARLAAANSMFAALAEQDIGQDGLLLRERLGDNPAFRTLQLLALNPDGRLLGAAYEIPLTRAQLNTVRAGGSALVAVAVDEPVGALHLVRNVRAGRSTRVAVLELSADWLWAPLHDLTEDLQVAAFDPAGAAIYRNGSVDVELTGLFRNGVQSSLRPGARHALNWQSHGEAWSGSLAALSMVDAYTSPPLAVIVSRRSPSIWARLQPIAVLLPALSAFALLAALLAAALLSHAYVPGLQRLRVALGDWRERRPATLRALHARDEVRVVMEGFNRSAAVIDRRIETLHKLGEIDTLLLRSVDLEAVLEDVLVRIREVMLCRVVGLTLIDADAPEYGRLFAAGSDEANLPVARVELDTSLVETFAAAEDGLTIARCEEGRHSFLMPLNRIGAQFFWTWPIFAGDRLAAILSVGYLEAPQVDAGVAAVGTSCAQRLSVAMSSSARAETLYRQAHFDPLTSLPNRLLFRDRLAQELSTVAGSANRGALLYIDLDHFKKVNDSLGHEAGDQLLAITGQRLRSCVKDGDTVARLAGDEFTVILRQVLDPAAALAVADRIIESLQMPVNIAGQDHQVRASIGITLFPDDGATIEVLMRNADLAMYRAKDRGRGAAVFFDRRMVNRDSRVPDSGLYRALKRREFSLFYQPQYNLADGTLLGVEALLRWDSPREGMRSPADFVPAAEESGLIVDIGSWVLEAACAQIATWRSQGLAPPRVAVNVSAQQLRDSSLVTLTRRLLDKYSLPADMLELELTEAAFADDESSLAIDALARLGVRLTLDDFGTGYSALTHLRRYPVRAVKIDRSCVAAVTDAESSASLVETIILMAHTLGKQVVAEGVETIEQLDFLREHGCDVVQGYYLARPLQAASMSEMLAARLPDANRRESAATG